MCTGTKTCELTAGELFVSYFEMALIAKVVKAQPALQDRTVCETTNHLGEVLGIARALLQHERVRHVFPEMVVPASAEERESAAHLELMFRLFFAGERHLYVDDTGFEFVEPEAA